MSRKFLLTCGLVFAAALCLFAAVSRAAEGEEAPPADDNSDPDVIALKDGTYDEEVKKHDLLLVEFYAPWCGHCKALKPKYQEAAKMLLDNPETKNFRLAKVDATAETKIANQHRIDGYPTLKLFRMGEVAEEFEGDRTPEGIVAFMKKKGAMAVNKELATTKEFREATKAATLTSTRVVGVFASKESVDYKYFKAVALMFAGTGIDVFHASNPSVLENIGFYGSGSAIHVYRPHLKPIKVTFKGTLFKQDLHDFIMANALPAEAVNEYTENNAKLFDKTGDSVIRVVTDGTNPTVAATLAKAVKNADELAKKIGGGGIRFATSKWDEFEKEAEKECGAESKKAKLCVLAKYGGKVKGKAGAVHGLDASTGAAFSESSFNEFVQAFVEKKLKAKVKSEAVPSEGPAAGKVLEIVGNTFAEQVLESDKSLLIKFYAPWCGHCKALAPKFEKLAEEMADKFDDVVIAKFNLDANEMPAEARSAYSVSGFPTLYFAKKGSKLSPKQFEGKREVEDMKKFVEANI